MNQLYFGDNLIILRDHIPSESVDLIYLDPPFNSKRNYNVYLNTPKGHQSDAQITAFEDTWHWSDQTTDELHQILHQPNTNVSELINAFTKFLHQSDMMAYLVMMTNRLLELHRVLKPTGSLYLHCDPTASHYLKIVLDNVFGSDNFQNEITWKRSHAHGNVGRNYGSIADLILWYTKTDLYSWNQPYTQLTDEEILEKYPNVDQNGRRWQSVTLRNPGPRPNLHYPYTARNGITYQPHPNGWSCNIEKMQYYEDTDHLHYPTKTEGALRLKMYADESLGERAQNIWTDIPPIASQAAERLGYPTQKPVALLERIIQTSSNPGDVVLDPFCGCGTAVHAAQKLNRAWIGIDITHLAIHLIERRLKDAFPNIQAGTHYTVFGIPKDLDSARDLALRDKYEFQFWACSLVNAQPYKGGKKGADTGIDGIIYFQDSANKTEKIIVSVKGGETVTRTYIADLKNTVERESAVMGIFIALADPTKPMLQEAAAAGLYTTPYGEQYPKIQILTIHDLLNGSTPKYRDYTRGAATFKKTKTEITQTNQPKLIE